MTEALEILKAIKTIANEINEYLDKKNNKDHTQREHQSNWDSCTDNHSLIRSLSLRHDSTGVKSHERIRMLET